MTRPPDPDVIDAYMANPWTFVLCRAFNLHVWEPVSAENELDSGWRCSDCGQLILKREMVERDYEGEVTSPYWGRRKRPPGIPKT